MDVILLHGIRPRSFVLNCSSDRPAEASYALSRIEPSSNNNNAHVPRWLSISPAHNPSNHNITRLKWRTVFVFVLLLKSVGWWSSVAWFCSYRCFCSAGCCVVAKRRRFRWQIVLLLDHLHNYPHHQLWVNRMVLPSDRFVWHGILWFICLSTHYWAAPLPLSHVVIVLGEHNNNMSWGIWGEPVIKNLFSQANQGHQEVQWLIGGKDMKLWTTVQKFNFLFYFIEIQWVIKVKWHFTDKLMVVVIMNWFPVHK